MVLPGLGQPAPSPAVPEPTPASVNPFVGSVTVKLDAPAAHEIWWSTTGTGNLDSGQGQLYTGEITIDTTATLRTVAVYNGQGQARQPANYDYVEDTKPRISSFTPQNGASFPMGGVVTLNASVTDAEGGTLSLDYYRSGTDGWIKLNGPSLTGPYMYGWTIGGSDPLGPVQLRAVARDPQGLADTVTRNITVTEANQPPTVNLALQPANPSPIAPASFTLAASATDDGAIAKVEFFQNGVLLGADSVGPTWSYPVSGLAAGAYSFTARATDNGSLSTTSAPIYFTAVANKLPVVQIIAPPTGSAYLAPAGFDLVATASDSDGTIARVVFYQGNDSIGTGIGGSAGYTLALTGRPAGNYQYTAKAVDNLNGSRLSTAISVRVNNPNRPPSIRINTPTAGTYIATYAANLSATASDSDGSVARVDFFVNGALERTLTAAPYSYSRNFTTPGTYAIRARATDNAGDTAAAGVSITVVANQRPVARVPKDTGIVRLPGTYLLNGSGSTDPENEALTYSWSGPTGVTFNNANAANPTATFSAGGAYPIKLTVTDPRGLSDDTTVIVSAWTAPIINGNMSASGQVGSPFSYTVSASGYPAPTLGANNRPAWLNFNAATGLLSGTPTASGVVNIGLVASNSAGSDSKTLALSISDQPSRPTIISPLKDTAKVDSAFRYTIVATGTPSNFTYAATPLPQGLTLSGAEIRGTPINRGSANIVIRVTNTQGFDEKTLNLLTFMNPRITQDLADTLYVVQEQSPITFTFRALAYPDINAYQWQYSSVSATSGFGNVGTNSDTYTINPATLASAGWYRAIARNGVGPAVISRVCRLRVDPKPAPVKITLQPTAQTGTVGARAEFRSKASGEPLPLYYQWFRGKPPNRRPVTPAPKENDSVFTIAAAAVSDADVYSLRVTNATKDTLNAANFAWSDTVRLTVDLPRLAEPVPNPPGGTIRLPTLVALSHNASGVAIWYTLDGSVPDPASPASAEYRGPILIDASRTLKAIAVAGGFLPSNVMKADYDLIPDNKLAKPVIKPVDSVFAGTLKVTITSPDGGGILFSLNGGPYANYPDTGFTISDSTLVRAVSVKPGLLASDTAAKVYVPSRPKQKVLDPQFTPDGGPFSGILIVRISSSTPSAVVRYTTDGSDPDGSSPIVSERGISITATTRIKAIGMLKDYANSDIVAREFRLGPGAITAVPHADSIFKGSLNIRLSVSPPEAIIHYSTDATLLPTQQSPVFPGTGLEIANTTTISAIAYLGDVPGKVQTFSYTLEGGPLVTPLATTAQGSYTFKDTTRVSLSSTPNARIYYTTDGSEPIAATAKLYKVPFMLDTTTTIQAIAMAEGFENSPMLVATYTLVPEKPAINPPGGSYPLPKTIYLKSTSPKASIYYTRNGTTPTAATGIPYLRETPIVIDTPCVIKAVAVAGNMSSEVASEAYTRTRITDTTLAPGQTLFLDGNYTLRNPENGRATARVGIGSPSLSGMPGFNGVLFTLNLSLANLPGNAGLEFPKLAFSKPASEKRSLYKLEPSGMIFFVSSAGTDSLGAGTYFMGFDTLPPTIKYTDEAYDPQDSTRVTFEVSDNVARLNYTVYRNDKPDWKAPPVNVFSDQGVSALLKHPPGIVKPLYVQLMVSDYQNPAYYPADKQIMLPLSQKLKPLQGPTAWKIGANAKNLYDFVGIPLALDPPLTLGGLRALNPAAGIEGAEYGNADKNFHALPESTVLAPGKAFWLASRSPVTSLRIPQASTLPGAGKSVFTVALRNGMNQISNPHLETLYWPITLGMKDYKTRVVKALWAWDASLPKPDYRRSDSLVPWRGYFVQNWGNDTVITLLSRSPQQAASKAAADDAVIQLSMGWDGRPALLLGADLASRDAIGIEDEEALPARGDRYLRATRNGRHLASDWIRLDRGGVERWRVEFGSAEDTLPALRVAEAALPEGNEAWALSPSRGMKFALKPGAAIPASGLARDSLIVVAGPKAQLEALDLMRGLSEHAPRLDAKIAMSPEGFRLRLALPSSARVRATVWSLRGSRLGNLATGLLSEGMYDFAFARDFSGRPARLAPGLYALSIEVRGQAVSSRITRKLLIAR